jgi:hypothetical protein
VYYKFWLSPCTLIFTGVYQLSVSLAEVEGVCIASVSREGPEQTHSGQSAFRYRIECIEGEITFGATGYTQVVRREPVLTSAQVFTEEQRRRITISSSQTARPTASVHRLIRDRLRLGSRGRCG